MSGIKITALPPETSPAGDNPLPSVNTAAGQTRKTTFTVFKDWLQSLVGWVTTPMVADGAIDNTKLLSTIFKDEITSGTNGGTMGGTYHLLNIGGLKIAYGRTNQVGTGNKTVILPSFFTAVKSGSITPAGPYVNTNVVGGTWANDLTGQTTTFTITPLVLGGSNPSNRYAWVIIGV